MKYLIIILFLLINSVVYAQPQLFKHPLQPTNRGKHSLETHITELDLELIKNNPQHLSVNLPGKVNFIISRSNFNVRGPKNMMWHGKNKNANLVLTQFEDVLNGRLELDNEVYSISTINNQLILEKLDTTSFPPEWGHDSPTRGKELFPDQPSNYIQPSAFEQLTPDLINITVMSVYTPQAKDAAGGTTQIQAAIQTAVDQANIALFNSNMNFRFSLVHTSEVTYNDSGDIITDLVWFQSDPTVISLRNLYVADLISLIVSNGGGYCGVGYLQQYPGLSFAPYAVQVTARSCLVNHTWSHEHGHNLGMSHDPANASGASYPWSYGHNVAGSFRTIMSYACPEPCPRVSHYSNPSVLYNGLPTGIQDQRDNARTGNLVAPIATNFRSGVSPPTNLIVK